MHRIILLLVVLLLLPACKIKPTPREYIDRTVQPAESLEVLERMLAQRAGGMSAALGRNDAGGAAAALHPSPDLVVVGEELSGPAALVARLVELPAAEARADVWRWGVHTEADPRLLWFVLELDSGSASGLYRREEGEWRLALFHLTPHPQ